MIKLTISPYKNFVERADETAKVTLKKFKQEFKLYERLFSLFEETNDCIAKSTENELLDSTAKNAVLFILPRIVQSLQSIRLLTAKGHYYDSAIIKRALLESIGLCEYLSSSEEEADRWFHGKKIKLASIHLFDYALRIDHAKTETFYGLLCDYVHTNLRGALSLYGGRAKVEKRKQTDITGSVKVKFQFAPKFDQKEVIGISSYPMLATLMLEHIFKKELEPYENRQKKSDRLTKLWLKNLQFTYSTCRKNPTKTPQESTNHP
jgi:hypothetical protein